MPEGTQNEANKRCAAALRAISEAMSLAPPPEKADAAELGAACCKLTEARDEYASAAVAYTAVLIEQDRPRDAKALRECVVPTLTAAGSRIAQWRLRLSKEKQK